MDKSSNKNAKWVIVGSIVFIVAIIFAVGPFLVTKYMRAKWQNGPKYKVSNLLMNVSGELKISSDNKYYLKGNNGAFYVLEGIKQDISDYKDKQCSVVGKFRPATKVDTIDGNSVRLFIGVDRLSFKDDDNFILDNNADKPKKDNVKPDIDIKEKSLKKARLRVEANARLSKKILFDVIKGKVTSVKRVDKNKKEYTALVLTDEFGDNYMLYKKGKDLSSLENKEIIVLGREIMPPSNISLIVDETTFEIYEVYDTAYNKLM